MTDKQPSEKAMAVASKLMGVRNTGGFKRKLARALDDFADAVRREENDLAIEALERLLRRAANGDISSGDVRAERDAIAARRRP